MITGDAVWIAAVLGGVLLGGFVVWFLFLRRR
jgi:LPXTG-motif cell wall-anchored protein